MKIKLEKATYRARESRKEKNSCDHSKEQVFLTLIDCSLSFAFVFALQLLLRTWKVKRLQFCQRESPDPRRSYRTEASTCPKLQRGTHLKVIYTVQRWITSSPLKYPQIPHLRWNTRLKTRVDADVAWIVFPLYMHWEEESLSEKSDRSLSLSREEIHSPLFFIFLFLFFSVVNFSTSLWAVKCEESRELKKFYLFGSGFGEKNNATFLTLYFQCLHKKILYFKRKILVILNFY